MFSPESEPLTNNAIDRDRSGNRNQDAGIAPEIEASDIDFSGTTERQVDTETRNDEEDDDGRRAEHESAPGVPHETPKTGPGVVITEKRNHLNMADRNPKRQDEAECIKDGEVSDPKERRAEGARRCGFDFHSVAEVGEAGRGLHHTRSAILPSMRLKKIRPPKSTALTIATEAYRVAAGACPVPVSAQRKPSMTPAMG